MDDHGQALPEYALVLALFAMAAIAGFTGLGAVANQQLNTTASGLTNIGVNPP